MVDLFIAEVKKQMYIRGWKYNDLAKATGYKPSTIKAFMIDKPDRDKSDAVKKSICNVLNIRK